MDPNLILLRNHWLFWKLSSREYKELNIKNDFIKAKKKDYIYQDSFSNDRLYFLKKGYIKIGHFDSDGNEIIIEVIQKGDIFGQFNLDSNSYNKEFAQVIKTDASICSFTIYDFQKILEKRPDLAISYTKFIGIKFTRIKNHFKNIIQKDVRKRLINFLIFLNENSENKDYLVLENYLTHAEIANIIGSTRQTVTTIINELIKSGLIQFDRKYIVIQSLNDLRKLSSGN